MPNEGELHADTGSAKIGDRCPAQPNPDAPGESELLALGSDRDGNVAHNCNRGSGKTGVLVDEQIDQADTDSDRDSGDCPAGRDDDFPPVAGPELAGLSDGNDAADAVMTAAEVPHVAEKSTPKNVLSFATRGKSPKRKVSLKSKNKSATRGKSLPVVEAGKGSKGTWQIRLRWNSEPGRPVEYVATITDAVYDLIRNGDYESYKQQTIASYEARTVSARHTA